MPTTTDLEQRNRALVAFALITGARDMALATIKVKHVDLATGCLNQDARELKTKFSKTFTTHFFPAGNGVVKIVAEWINHLRLNSKRSANPTLAPSMTAC